MTQCVFLSCPRQSHLHLKPWRWRHVLRACKHAEEKKHAPSISDTSYCIYCNFVHDLTSYQKTFKALAIGVIQICCNHKDCYATVRGSILDSRKCSSCKLAMGTRTEDHCPRMRPSCQGILHHLNRPTMMPIRIPPTAKIC